MVYQVGEQWPKKAKGIECKLGFGDDFFCDSCMVAEREHRLGKGDTNDQTSVKQALRRSSGRDKGSTNSANNSDVNLGSVNKDTILLDPLLSYVVFALQSGSVEIVKNAVLGYFSNVDINLTKDLLWSHCGTEGIGEKPKRKGSNLRSEAEANLMDIISSWMKLDRANNTPIIAICAENLRTIARSHPEELNAITLVDRLNQLEQRMTNMQTNMDCMMAHNMNLNDQVKDLSSYASRVKSPVVPVPVLTRDIHGNKTDAVENHAESLPIDHTLHADPKQTKQKEQSQNDFSNTLTDSNDDGFQLPSEALRRQRRAATRKQKVVSGSKNTSNIRGAPEPSRDIFVYRVHGDTSLEEMHQYITSQGFTVRDIKCTSKAESIFKSFCVTLPLSQFKDAFQPTVWPEGVRMRRFWPKKDANHAQPETNSGETLK